MVKTWVTFHGVDASPPPAAGPMQVPMPMVFDHLDYRRFLSDYYAWKKARRGSFSMQVMALKAGMDTSNLAKVLAGKRHLPAGAIARFREVCGFSEEEQAHFARLVVWQKARDPAKAKSLFEKIAKSQKARPHILDGRKYDYYSRWYYIAVYTLLECMDFRGTPREYRSLATRLNPALSLEEARASIELLIELGLVAVDAEGRHIPVQKSLSTGERWKSYAVERFQAETLDLAKRSLEAIPKEERDISTLTFSATQDELETLNRLTKEYRRSIVELISSGRGGGRVYQMNLQLFPLSA